MNDDPALQARVDAGWTRLAERIETVESEPWRRPSERLLLRLGVPEHAARLALATPVLRRSWLVATGMTVAFSACAARLTAAGTGAVVFLAVTPLLPLFGVALSYGPAVDPMGELALVAPMDSLRRVLLRTIPTSVSGILVTALGALALPQGPALPGWLLPSLVLTLLALCLSAWLTTASAVGLTLLMWVLLLAATTREGPTSGYSSQLLTTTGQLALAAAAVGTAGALFRLRSRFEYCPRGDLRTRPFNT
ncbi:zf-HC2 domain-containing protein [Streptomyces sp. MS06]|uniref:zf-HC2 domain-containing protein n=1 Tax=Streptomyces sp. MS06 TaxID=3385974 RepID=UPI0039A0AE64